MKSKIMAKAAGVTSIVALAFILGIVYIQATGNWPTAQLQRDVHLGESTIELPDWSFTLSNDESDQLSNYRGQILIVELMTTWCTSCKAQIPLFENLLLIRNDIQILALTVDKAETPQMMADYKTSEGFSWPCGVEAEGTFSQFLDVSLVPTIIIIDQSGYLRWIHEGTWSSASLNSTLDSIGL
ncbi:MAG: TlpA family protein disulfide reductase [Candidatus Thorarchaeota archaeon]